jgi:uncharacterized protein
VTGGPDVQRGPIEVAELWRYPVKSLRGERLATAALDHDGLPGDRRIHVAGDRGLLTGRTRYGLLTLGAQTGPGGEPLVEGHHWDSVAARAALAAVAGDDVRLVADGTPARFDVLPLLVSTRSEVDRLGVDARRLRPNIILDGAIGPAERSWPGHALRIGEALIGVHSLRPRCIVTTIDPDTGSQDLDVLRRIRQVFDGATSLNCWVIRPGAIRVGDDVEVVDLPLSLDGDELPRPGGWVTGAPYPAREDRVRSRNAAPLARLPHSLI